ncbi:MAG TPA: DnaB-like helicase C-terminal domain-containing protein [Actinoplanes sp.]|nr:DnaB-like helicase C-terminal domain-containing protein [Actinoplanes sp.]
MNRDFPAEQLGIVDTGPPHQDRDAQPALVRADDADLLFDIFGDSPDSRSRRLPTGIPGLDALGVGLGRGNLVVFAGVSSSGLSTALFTVAEQTAVRRQISTLWIDEESPIDLVAERMVSGLASVNRTRFTDPGLSGDEAGRIRAARARLRRSPLRILGRLETTAAVEQELASEPEVPRVLIIDGVRFLDHGAADIPYAEHLTGLGERLKRLAMRLQITICVAHPVVDLPATDPMETEDLYPFAAVSDNLILLRTERGRAGQAQTLMSLEKSRTSPLGQFPITPRFAFARFESYPETGGV